MVISIIVAVDKNGLIGDGPRGMPWHLPADFKYFKKVTDGKPVIMGRATYDTIGKPLPNRKNIILTRDLGFSAEGVEVAHGVKEALEKAGDVTEIMVIGGRKVYEQFLPLANRIYITRIQAEFTGSIYFPKVDWNEWEEVQNEPHGPDKKNPYPYTFFIYERLNLNNPI